MGQIVLANAFAGAISRAFEVPIAKQFATVPDAMSAFDFTAGDESASHVLSASWLMGMAARASVARRCSDPGRGTHALRDRPVPGQFHRMVRPRHRPGRSPGWAPSRCRCARRPRQVECLLQRGRLRSSAETRRRAAQISSHGSGPRRPGKDSWPAGRVVPPGRRSGKLLKEYEPAPRFTRYGSFGATVPRATCNRARRGR